MLWLVPDVVPNSNPKLAHKPKLALGLTGRGGWLVPDGTRLVQDGPVHCAAWRDTDSA